MKRSILIAEDEKSIANSLSYCLEKEGFETIIAYDGADALVKFKNNKPNLILLDIMLPKINGQDVCKTIRKNSNVSIIMLTAKDSELDKVAGLQIGADDYITKPFSMQELIARINAVLRRSPNKEEAIIDAAPFTLNEQKHEITLNNRVLNLPLKQYEILKTLIKNNGKVVSRENLFRIVWGEDFFGDEKTLDVHIRELRKNIEEDNNQSKYIRTVRGVGYKLAMIE